MWFKLRYTVRRGRSAEPCTFLRMRRWRRCRPSYRGVALDFIVPSVRLGTPAYADFPPAALPALRRMYSPAYLMPLPLYGSGGLKPRMFAATCPTSPLSNPFTVSFVGVSTAIVMPAGGSNSIGCE